MPTSFLPDDDGDNNNSGSSGNGMPTTPFLPDDDDDDDNNNGTSSSIMPTPFLPDDDDDDDNNSGSSSSGSGDSSNSSDDGIDNPLQLNWIAIPEAFEQNCNTLREFIVFRQKLPSNNSDDKKERKLYTFISRQRQLQQQNNLDPAREALLNSINPGILGYHRRFVDDKLIPPSDEWKKVFEHFNTKTNRNTMAKYILPSTGKPYVTTKMAGSFHEYLLRKIGHQYFSPDECHAGRTHGTVQHLVSYILDESSRPKNVPDKSKYDEIIVTRDKELLRHHSYSSSYFPPKSQTDDFKEALDKALKDIMMDDAVLDKIRRCNTIEAVLEIEQRNPFFDTYHFSEAGKNKKFVPIMTTTMQQPRRMSFSTYTESPKLFPTLGVKCQRLFSYGAFGRAAADGRCRQIPISIYNLMVKAWEQSYHRLSPLSKLFPPNNVQVLVYVRVHGESKSGNIIELHNRYMGIHRDNGYLDIDNDSHMGGNHDREMNSHIVGTDVLTVNAGDDMVYQLIYPDKDDDQDYRFTQAQAKTNKRKGLVNSHPVEHGSIHVHTAHDDEIFQHAAEFGKITGEKKEGTEVRIAFIGRWLCVPAFFRQNKNDPPSVRYSMVNKRAYDKIKNMGVQKEEWIRVLEINETINDLLGYKLVGGTTKKRPEREQPIREAKNKKTKK
ncbi:hypothetical protein ACHAWC_007198 [Mediolabrus comicus]